MSVRVGAINTAAAVVALALALGAASYGVRRSPAARAPSRSPAVEIVELSDGRRGLRDATGEVVELKPYHRILAGSTVADRLLHELAEPERVVGVTAYGRAQSPWAYQQAGKPTLEGADSVEAVLALAPDLVVVNSLGQLDKVARLRERGIAVFDLGDMGGADMLVRSMHLVALLLGHPERGDRLATGWQRRLASVADVRGDRARRRGVYLSELSGKLFGGTRGSSYGDILLAAGLDDAAAGAYRGWPEYSAEELLRLDPELIVTKPGMGVQICRVNGLARLRACRSPDGFIEVEAALLDDPGLAMLDAAEAIFAAAYPDAR